MPRHLPVTLWLQVEEAKLKERQAAAAAAADEEAGGCARKASGGDSTTAVQVQNGEGDAASISSSVVQARRWSETLRSGPRAFGLSSGSCALALVGFGPEILDLIC